MENIQTTAAFRASLRAARRVGTPLIAIRSADPASAISHVVASLNGKSDETPLLSYDFVTGLSGRNQKGLAAVAAAAGDNTVLAPSEVLAAATRLPEDSILFYLNPQRVWEQADVLQAIWNLRDAFKPQGQMLVLLTTPGATLPAEVQNDVMVFDEPLPSADDLAELIAATFKSAGLKECGAATKTKAIDALVGLAMFPAETALAMSVSKKNPDSIDLDRLWERKRQAIEQTHGLTVWRGGDTFGDIGGCEQAKRYLRDMLAGREAARVIVFVDEIEKAFAGTGTDLSGVKTEMTGTALTWLQDHNADGVIFMGPPGAAKSAVAKAAGAEAGIPTIAFDFAAMESGIVGSSGERLRTALAVVEAISQGRSLWIGTCNSIGSLPTELRRRFQKTFFFDLPAAEERAAIWKIYESRWSLAGPRPDDQGWTGAEIKECCRTAYRLNLTLRESAAYIVPVSVSAGEQIQSLRKQASGKFLSASRPGVYSAEDKPAMAAVGVQGRRKFSTQDN